MDGQGTFKERESAEGGSGGRGPASAAVAAGKQGRLAGQRKLVCAVSCREAPYRDRAIVMNDR